MPLTSATLLDWMTGPKSEAGVTVSEKSSLGLSAVWRSVNLIAGTSASLPLKAYQDDERGVRRAARPGVLGQLHPDLTTYEWLELAFCHLCLWGNAYAKILRNEAGTIRELWPLEPSRVRAGRASDGSKVYGIDGVDLSGASTGELLPFTDREILHIPGFGYDGVTGMSPIRLARQGLGLAAAAERFGARFFGNNQMPAGILQSDAAISQEKADELKARWKATVGGPDRYHDIAVLGSGAKFERLTIPPEDAQFIETRKFQVAEIARMYGIPPHMLADTEKSTSWGTGIEQQSIGFVVYTLRPWLVRAEQRLSRLLPAPTYAKFTVEGLLRGDTKSRYDAYAVARQWGWMSINDIRRLEDMPPVDGGDQYLQPLNMVPLGQELAA